jgi:glycosyltransferase 2 family protein
VNGTYLPQRRRERRERRAEDQAVNKRLLLNLCKYAVALALLGVVIAFNWKKGEDNGLWYLWDKHVIQGQPVPGPQYFGLALLICACCVTLTFVRWYILVRAVGLPFKMSDAVRLGLVGYFFSSFLPGSVGGDILKAAFLAREHHRRTVAVATVIMDRVLSLWALIWFVAIVGGVLWATGRLEREEAIEQSHQAVLGAAAFCAVSLVVWTCVGFLGSERSERFALRLHRLPKVGGSAAEFWRAVWMYRCQPRCVLVVMGMAFTGFFGFVSVFYLSVLTLHEPSQKIPTFAEHFLIIPIGLVIQAIPGLPGGLGLGELGFGLLYKWMKCDVALGVLGSLVQRSINWILSSFGFLVYMRMKVALKNAVEEERELAAAEART